MVSVGKFWLFLHLANEKKKLFPLNKHLYFLLLVKGCNVKMLNTDGRSELFIRTAFTQGSGSSGLRKLIVKMSHKGSKKCLCSHYDNPALIKQISLFDTIPSGNRKK